jgi:hypothetical protein
VDFDLYQYYRFKDQLCKDRFPMISPILLKALVDVMLWCHLHNVNLEFTRSVDGPIEGISTSKTHESGRAVDVSVKGWSADKIYEFVKVFNERFKSIGAISSEDGKPRFVVYHVGTAPHFHIQISKDADKNRGL